MRYAHCVRYFHYIRYIHYAHYARLLDSAVMVYEILILPYGASLALGVHHHHSKSGQ